MKLRSIQSGFILLIFTLFAGCGGGGGGSSTPAASTLSGSAAVGTPIVNGTISVICAAGSTFSTTSSSTGAWQFTLSGQTLPCAVQLSGGTIGVGGANNLTSYTSIATATGTVNVTPLTDLLVANLMGMASPSAWFAGLTSPSAALAAITQTQVNTALTHLSAALPALAPLSTTNPITTSFTPTSGNVSDNMLAALATAIASNSAGVTYASLLTNASAPTFTPPAAGFGTALTATYAETFVEFTLPASSVPFGIAAGADGNLWYTDDSKNSIGKMTPSGVVTTYTIPTTTTSSCSSCPQTIISGPDGNLWFVEGDGNKIAKITTGGVITEYANSAGGWPQDLAVGPDGNIWFTDQGVTGGGAPGVAANGAIGKVNITTGVVTKYPLLTTNTQANWITLGPDGALWFTQSGGSNNTARITASGVITVFPNTAGGTITTGSDGNLWLAVGVGAVARLTTAGVMTIFPIPTATLTPFFITAGPDGNLWAGAVGGYWPNWTSVGGVLARVTTSGVVTEFSLPASTSSAAYPDMGAITVGPGGALWFADPRNGKIGHFGP